jgi:hypothetical protein
MTVAHGSISIALAPPRPDHCLVSDIFINSHANLSCSGFSAFVLTEQAGPARFLLTIAIGVVVEAQLSVGGRSPSLECVDTKIAM